MHPQLSDLDAAYLAVQGQVERAFAGLSETAIHQRPATGGWSVAECVAHLTLTTQAFLPLLDEALARCPPATGTGVRFRTSFLGWMLARSLEPPVRFRTRTTAPFVPSASGSAGSVVGEFVQSQESLRKRLRDSDGRDLNRARIRSPFNQRLSYNVFAAFRILAAHERRHVWQAERVLRGLREGKP